MSVEDGESRFTRGCAVHRRVTRSAARNCWLIAAGDRRTADDLEPNIEIRFGQIIACFFGPFDETDGIAAEVVRETRLAPFMGVPESIKIKVI